MGACTNQAGMNSAMSQGVLAEKHLNPNPFPGASDHRRRGYLYGRKTAHTQSHNHPSIHPRLTVAAAAAAVQYLLTHVAGEFLFSRPLDHTAFLSFPWPPFCCIQQLAPHKTQASQRCANAHRQPAPPLSHHLPNTLSFPWAHVVGIVVHDHPCIHCLPYPASRHLGRQSKLAWQAGMADQLPSLSQTTLAGHRTLLGTHWGGG